MRALLSIKPEFVERIFSGEKQFEFRRTIFRLPVKKIVIYETLPTSRVVGEFEVADLLYEPIASLWQATHRYAGISRDRFDEYFSDRQKGYAIKIGRVKRYRERVNLQETYCVSPPQSFIYLP